MKHLKMLGLFVMAAASLMAFAGSASAATFTAPAGNEYTGAIDATLEGSALLKAGFAEITCTTGTVKGEVTTNNDTHAHGPIQIVNFSNCGSATVDTLNNSGTLTISKATTEVVGNGVEVTTAVAGTSCIYGLGATNIKLGTAANTASGVTLAIKATLGKLGGGFLCANPATWTANYIVTTPAGSVVD